MTVHIRIMGLLAGLLGAAGVGAAALASHGGYGETLRTASEFALIHAVLVIALLRAPGRLAEIAAGLILLGALLFCGDLAMRALAGRALLPMAAPTGGFVLMAGWLAAGIAKCLNVNPK
ncbi:MAG: hypothetical protein JWN07_1625 [Hyphomicrobiales bacterium]|nr:hypothetical protein [Hyphomicrobiales bacterium]